ncbi:carbohydrate ABC transporter permease [Paenibacillus sp. CGMCC 1.16610]|uniref:ABC transporter permease subunit n=1 Tax=Paenibacillus anseongense TaxID=2682845 RepID=A0ABW9U747_9BACL|nr:MULTISPECIES: carbohydrate ABC transporter permease [Paenibacillus]MBA2939002.1 carbohydrate ABC transporter permease [Paenibacillus sp. CGMCC 1.16610]MVQ34964.1 ABC transporter permease subunit [Paenibacillus anseongense]
MKSTVGEKWFYTANYIILALLGITCLFPLINTIAVSLSDTHAIASGKVTFYPIGWNIEAYISMIQGTRILSALQNSIIITIVGVTLSMTVTIMTAYPISRGIFYGRRFFTLAMVFTMLFSGGLIPTYLVVKSLGLMNSYFALWLPALISTYNLLVMRTFFENIPSEVDDAARIDGCSEMAYLMRIVLPLSMPVIATITLFYSVSYWNMFMNVLIYINDTSKFNMTVLIQKMIQSQNLLQELVNSGATSGVTVDVVPESLKAAGVLIMVLPMLLVYPFLQKYFVKGVMLGSVKG